MGRNKRCLQSAHMNKHLGTAGIFYHQHLNTHYTPKPLFQGNTNICTDRPAQHHQPQVFMLSKLLYQKHFTAYPTTPKHSHNTTTFGQNLQNAISAAKLTTQQYFGGKNRHTEPSKNASSLDESKTTTNYLGHSGDRWFSGSVQVRQSERSGTYN